MTQMIFWAVSPAILIVIYFFLRDRFREPPRIVLYTFALGVLSCIPILIVNIPLDIYGYSLNTSNFGRDFYKNILRAAFHEEFYKFIILYYFCARHTEFNEPMDAIVYGVAASLGFSALENVNYVLSHESYYTTWQEMAYIRVFPTIMHGTNGVIMGLLLSKVLFVHRNHTKLILALLIPVLIHGSYNLIITYLPGLGILLLIILVIYIFILMRRIRKLQASKIIEAEIKETINHSIVFQSIFISFVAVVILVAIVVLI